MIAELPLNDLAFPASTDSGFLESLAEECAHSTVSMFLRVHGQGIQAKSSDLFELLSDACRQRLPYETIWDIRLGRILSGLSPAAERIEERAASLALRLHECGQTGGWQLALDQPTGIRFDRWYVDSTLRVQCEPAGTVTLSRRSDHFWRETRFVREQGNWTLVSGQATALPEVSATGGRWLILGRDHLTDPEAEDIASDMDDRQPWLVGSRCLRVRELLTQRSPIFSRWVEKVVRLIAPWHALPDERPSGSSSSSLAPGLVGIGNHDHILALSDSLVHEASHNYFYLALRLGGVHDGSDTRLYYNPFLECKRPIDRILLAYHAFANVLLFVRDLQANALNDPYLSDRERLLVERLVPLQNALESTPALTRLGQALFKPLREEIQI